MIHRPHSRPALLVALLAVLATAAIAAGCSSGGGDDGAQAAGAGSETTVDAGPQNRPGEGMPDVAPTDGQPAGDVDSALAYLDGIPQQGATLGDATAPVEIIEYGDFLCSFCQRFSQETLPTLIDDHIRPGNVKITFSPVAFYGEDSERGALGALAAGEQNRLWQFTEAAYARQGASGYLSEGFLEDLAGRSGLNVSRWQQDFRSDAVGEEFLDGLGQAQAAGVQGTPTFVVRGPSNAVLIPGSLPADQWDRAIAEVS